MGGRTGQTTYEDSLPVPEARQRYFDDNGFTEAGYDDRWVVVRVGGLHIPAFPNSAARRRAVKLHDLHHVATGYQTDWTGEAEIGAWEVGGGCHHHLAAWYLNVSVMGIGVLIAPRATWRAFLRGRQSRTLYDGEFSESLLDGTVGALRSRLGLDREPAPPTPADRLVFAGFAALALAQLLGPSTILSAWLLR